MFRTVETRPTQLWEVIVVISCPVLFVLFLCCCIVCMIIKNYDRQPTVEPLRRQNLGRIMRQLPPPPKYDVGKPLFELNSKASHLLCSVVPNHRFW
ncbi:unnamed protein product [Heligmosomoides polygyrus]|uniref:Uncharacterized protein n=1 Tax=Heligmosomoides polygyrus TaxID=6339 RepID=A0A3P7Y5R2_HELPZ|nr:unnamed protein product [Heligmosomoides polygyrus]